ncbi:MAG: hypothetical protein V4726_09870 [Verrucomicrobiota bacterium]
MKNSSLTPLCLAAAVGLGVWGGWEHVQRTRLAEELKAAVTERDTLRLTANQKISLAAKTPVNPSGPEGLGPGHADALKAEEEAGKKPETPAPNVMGEAMSKMMKDPAMRDMMKSQARGQVDFMYRDLMDMLNLPPEKRDALTKILTDRADIGMEMGMAMMSGKKPTEEEKKAQSEAMAKMTTDTDKALKELLGDEDYPKFDQFEKSQPERMQLNSLTAQLKDAGLELAPEAETQLMDAMYEERTQFKFDNDMGNQKNTDMSRLTPENIQRYQDQTAILRGKVYDRAAKILTPEQLPVFKKSQDTQAAMEKMGMEMAGKMFQPAKEEK